MPVAYMKEPLLTPVCNACAYERYCIMLDNICDTGNGTDRSHDMFKERGTGGGLR